MLQAPSKAAQSSELWKNRDQYPMIDRGEYIMHPRNSSLVHDLSDPVTVHVNTAEAMVRRGIRSNPNLPVIANLAEFNYIENKTIERQFEVIFLSICSGESFSGFCFKLGPIFSNNAKSGTEFGARFCIF